MKITKLEQDNAPYVSIELTKKEFSELKEFIASYPKILPPTMHKLHIATYSVSRKED